MTELTTCALSQPDLNLFNDFWAKATSLLELPAKRLEVEQGLAGLIGWSPMALCCTVAASLFWSPLRCGLTSSPWLTAQVMKASKTPSIGCAPPSTAPTPFIVCGTTSRAMTYNHFIALGHPYSATSVAQAFFYQIVRLHGLPYSTVKLCLPPADGRPVGGDQPHPRHLPALPRRRSSKELAVLAPLGRVLLQLVLPDNPACYAVRGCQQRSS